MFDYFSVKMLTEFKARKLNPDIKASLGYERFVVFDILSIR